MPSQSVEYHNFNSVQISITKKYDNILLTYFDLQTLT